MLLNELNQTPLASFEQTSKLLENTFGVKVEFTNDLNKLRNAESKATAIIENLKYQNHAIDNAEVSKYSLINEALTCLIEHENKQRIDELKMGYANSSTYRRIVDGLAEFVDNSMDIGDSFEEALADAMKQYRSSKYRYPDYEIEADVQREVHIRNGEELGSHTEVSPTNLLDSMSLDEVMEALEEMKAINEGLLTESDVDFTRLNEIADAIIAEDYKGALMLQLQKRQEEQDAADAKGVTVDYPNGDQVHDPRDPKLQALKLKLAQQKKKEQLNAEVEVDEKCFDGTDDCNQDNATPAAKEFVKAREKARAKQ